MSTYKKGQMHNIAQLRSGQGIEQEEWHWPGADKAAFINKDVYVKAVQLTEKGEVNNFFLTNTPAMYIHINKMSSNHSLDL